MNARGCAEVICLAVPDGADVTAVVPALRGPVDDGLVTLLDVVLLRRLPDGRLDQARDDVLLAGLPVAAPPLLSAADLTLIGDSLADGDTGVVVVWDHVWAAPMTARLDALGAGICLRASVPVRAMEAAFAPGSTCPAWPSGLVNHLAALARLHLDGVLTRAEFQTARLRLLQ